MEIVLAGLAGIFGTTACVVILMYAAHKWGV